MCVCVSNFKLFFCSILNKLHVTQYYYFGTVLAPPSQAWQAPTGQSNTVHTLIHSSQVIFCEMTVEHKVQFVFPFSRLAASEITGYNIHNVSVQNIFNNLQMLATRVKGLMNKIVCGTFQL